MRERDNEEEEEGWGGSEEDFKGKMSMRRMDA